MKKIDALMRGPAAAATLVAILLAAGCGDRGKDDDDKPGPTAAAASAAAANAGAPPEQKPLSLSQGEAQQAGIRTETIQPTSMHATLVLTGSVSANLDRLAKVVPRLPGRITAVPVSLGADVARGQTLAIVESIELGEARSALLQARSEAEVANAALARAEKLSAEDIVPRKDYLRAKADAERARASLRAAQDKLHMLGVPQDVPRGRADGVFAMTSPFSGTVIEKQAVNGTLADKEPLFTVADLSSVWVVADVFERDLARLDKGAMAEVSVAAYPGERFPGRLGYVSDTLDPATKTVRARVEVANANRRLKPGMFATVSLPSSSSQQALALPASAVTLLDGKPAVFVAKDGTFVARRVETGPELDGRVPITLGLTTGEQVVTQGAYALKARMLKSQLGTDKD